MTSEKLRKNSDFQLKKLLVTSGWDCISQGTEDETITLLHRRRTEDEEDGTHVGFQSDGDGGLIMYRHIDYMTDPDIQDIDEEDVPEEKVMHIPATWLTNNKRDLEEYDLDRGKEHYDNWRGSGR